MTSAEQTTAGRLKRLLVACLLCLSLLSIFDGVPTTVAASTGMGIEEPDLALEAPIYYFDYPGSLFSNAVLGNFPFSYIERLKSETSVHQEELADSLMLLPENRAHTLRANAANQSEVAFEPIYEASLVIAYDSERIRHDLRSWKDLLIVAKAGELPELGVLLEPEYVLASAALYLDQSEDAELIRTLAELNDQGKLKLFRGSDANSGWPVSLISGGLETRELPAVLLLWDYQAAQINRKLGSNSYTFHLPYEGSLSLSFGLYANGRKAKNTLESRLQEETRLSLAENFIAFGYRMADGSSPRTLKAFSNPLLGDEVSTYGYPEPDEYRAPAMTYRDYGDLNQIFLSSTAKLRRDVLGKSVILPATPEEEHVLLVLLIPIFLIWAATIFFRIDDVAIRRSITLLSLWFSLAIILFFVQTMYANSARNDIIYYIRFLPFVGMIESWFYTGFSLARSQGLIKERHRRLPLLCSMIFYALGVAFVLNDLHGYAFTLSPFMRIQKLGPLGYLLLLAILGLWLAGFFLLLKCQAKIYTSTWVFPLAAFVALCALNIYLFISDGSLRSTSFDLLNLVGIAVILELSLQTRLIPANSGYIKLFRYSNVGLRLINEDRSEVYPPERDNIPSASAALINEAIEQDLASRPENSGVGVAVPSAEQEGLIYHTSKINGGYLIWEEDISDVLKLKHELTYLMERLEQQGRILARRRNIRGQYLSMKIRREMMQRLESSLSTQLQEIRKSLREIEASEDKNFVRQELGRVKIMVSQCKRKSNLLVRAEAEIQAEEVSLIFNEALQDAGTADISGLVLVQGSVPLATDILLALYDYVMYLLAKAVGLNSTSLFLNLRWDQEKLTLQIIFSSAEPSPESFFQPGSDLLPELRRLKLDLHIEVDGNDCNIRIVREEGK
ncbi:MAG: hypothetical protein Q4E09_01270 [Eubacteriales bacterium]|nr:hypothetical protein [Eubacteriales bacterium]